VIFSTVRILRQIKADRSSVDVEDGIVLVWKRGKIPGNRLRERGRAPQGVRDTHSSISSRASV